MDIKTLYYVFLEIRVKILLLMILLFTLVLTIYYLGYNLPINSVVYGLLLLMSYKLLIKKDVGKYGSLQLAFRIWVPLVILMYVGIFFGLLYTVFHHSESMGVLEEIGREIVKLKNPERIFLFNLSRGILAIIPYIGPFIMGIALGNSGFIMGIALRKLLDLRYYKDFTIMFLVPFHPYGFLELLSYSFFIASSLYIRAKKWKYMLISIFIAVLVLLIAAYLEVWELEIYKYRSSNV